MENNCASLPKGTSQAARNPFPYSDSNKRYHTYDYYLRRTFGGKCAKIPLDAGFSCPNIDGRCGVGGCIYCSGRGCGDFACTADVPIREQYDRTRVALSKKWSVERYIPHFQAHTNTYASTEVLRPLFEEALTFPGVVGMNIATRADCLPDGTVALLADLAERTTLTVELGLQSVHDATAQRINRGHVFAQFLDGYERLGAASPRISRCVHLIFGLPGEDDEMMLQTVRTVAALRPEQIKIHLMHVLRGTVLGDMYVRGEYTPLSRERYISLVVRSLTLLPKETVVGRLTGDGMGEALHAPDWSRKKVTVLNDIDKALYQNDLWQGCAYRA